MTFIQTAMGGNYDTIKNAVKRLEGVGLLMQSEVPGKNKYILVELTDLGFSVAEHLKRANDLILGVQTVDTTTGIIATGDDRVAPTAIADALASKRAGNAVRGGGERPLNNGDAEESAFGGGAHPPN